MTLELQIYTSLLADVKERIRGGQFRAAQSVNAELIQMYWDIGHMLHERQEQQGWGAGIIRSWHGILLMNCQRSKASQTGQFLTDLIFSVASAAI
ncbi:DUF1016 N-terminal domain-containing protein [Photorhabdus temperata]|uniref:YhcG N-terminal domain-containing protein n=1 Tax=Photorhabdus temperata J3 TaxID=1389415 RepID=U7QTW0_PHOTE|nr:DUF1016 N-terminal domain-containing protein [Photorhabdus temperata]ERT10520.1 hypothetical protein O185_24340 [Photorhabdus temperata J3]